MNMQNDRNPMLFSNSALNEYLIIALPYAEINGEVKEFKRDFFKRYGSFCGQNSCAHIRLMSFFQTEEREPRVIECVQNVLREIKAFEVFLSGFEFDSVSRSVYIDVVNKQSVADVYHQLRLSLFRQLVSLAFLNKHFVPKMHIGQDLSPLQFLHAVEDYQSKAYSNNFRLMRLHLLKRQAPYTVWENLAALPFARSENEMIGFC